MAMVTGLSGNEIYCMALKHYSPGEIVVGNSVQSMGFLGGMVSGFKNMAGGEIEPVTEAIESGRIKAFERMVAEAQREGAAGVTGVTGELMDFVGNTEFLFVGSCLMNDGPISAERAPSRAFFTSAGSGQELYCNIDAGYAPLHHVFGNIAYSTGIGGGIMGSLKTLVRGEITEYSDIFNATRHKALDRIVAQARGCGANAVVGIRTNVRFWHGAHEMLMTGTAARNPALPDQYLNNPVTSDLTGEELWAMSSLGYAPVKLLISASIYSLGMAGGLKAAFKAFTKGEISDLTTLIHDAREVAIGRLKSEADALGAQDVVGVKTYIAELGSSLVEFLAIGTAIKKIDGVGVTTPQLPVHAIVSDKDTWIDGTFGLSLDRNG
ncbi:heavy metal-binding domain-containing protein [Novosphingobium sp. G106]|uniref:heavy metal-binding domain-containing protein n=1 Tax=Novosphingobium sp. G106 TaxID=2849500 RepID=UPI001C2CDFCC|nr:heavy metal-binding domain-containing protein [Novosphingobium sp. G106]MBV1687507.1 heavy metal-binding domain-containing protein [Novosphingobium sp. G106]